MHSSSMTEKIDNRAVNGLTGTADSLAYIVAKILRHHHSWESWFETAAVPTATHKADRIGSGAGAFQIDAGNNTWGSWLQIAGSDDTPARSGGVEFDAHKLSISATERNSVYFIQIGCGASGAAALAAGTYTETPYNPVATKDSGPIRIQCDVVAVDTLIWARCMCPGQDTGTLDFFFGIHEYEG